MFYAFVSQDVISGRRYLWRVFERTQDITHKLSFHIFDVFLRKTSPKVFKFNLNAQVQKKKGN